MKNQTEIGWITHRKTLPASLAIVLAGALATAQAGGARIAGDRIASYRVVSFPEASLRPAPAVPNSDASPKVNVVVPRTVTTCADDGSPGTLRAQVANAVDGDTIDLSQLMCSTITLGSAIQIDQNNLTLKGPGATYLALDGANHSGVIEHAGFGTLAIYDLTITHGYRVGSYSSGGTGGGCIYARAGLSLVRSTVSHCVFGNISGDAKGGGVYAFGNLAMAGVTIRDSHAIAIGANKSALGGGAFARSGLEVKYSTISDNSAFGFGIGGGIFDALGNVSIEGSTISGNHANYDAGIELESTQPNTTAEITNSTISGNFAVGNRGGIDTAMPLKLYNSTVAFNRSGSTGNGAGLYSNKPLTLESSIIADNVAGSSQSDLGGNGTSVTGGHNLITSSSVSVPFNTIHTCPDLDPLADNGGPTRTHALRSTSAAIDNGSNYLVLTNDQRFAPRISGAVADIGAFERQPADVDQRLFVNGFDGLCDQ